MDVFWSIVVYAWLLGTGAVVGFVFFYWLVILPTRSESANSGRRTLAVHPLRVIGRRRANGTLAR